MTNDERFLNLALINVGEAVALISNLRQRGTPPGPEYGVAQEKLLRAVAALEGKVHAPT
jgi:hypothetical protein